jgi:hypothetical protein
MATDIGRRGFLSRILPRQAARLIDEARGADEDINPSFIGVSEAADDIRDVVAEFNNAYFACFENCYPLIAECGAMLAEEAARLQIPVEGKSRMEIAKDIWARLEGPPPLLKQSCRTGDKNLNSSERERH